MGIFRLVFKIIGASQINFLDFDNFTVLPGGDLEHLKASVFFGFENNLVTFLKRCIYVFPNKRK
jgi:hypothetical protein